METTDAEFQVSSKTHLKDLFYYWWGGGFMSKTSRRLEYI
jgi:hypothetical protein